MRHAEQCRHPAPSLWNARSGMQYDIRRGLKIASISHAKACNPHAVDQLLAWCQRFQPARRYLPDNIAASIDAPGSSSRSVLSCPPTSCNSTTLQNATAQCPPRASSGNDAPSPKLVIRSCGTRARMSLGRRSSRTLPNGLILPSDRLRIQGNYRS